MPRASSDAGTGFASFEEARLAAERIVPLKTRIPAKIYANEGIAQVLFFKGEEEPEISYRDKKGKYQGQHGVTLPRL